MTSFSANASKSATPQLFNIPQDQMQHVQVVTIEPTTLKRTLRLTGAVAYNAFNTTPVITQVGGPVSRILVVPGQHVKAGQPMLDVSSPDYSQLLDAYLKAADSFRLAEKFYARAQGLYEHHAIAERDLEQAESDRNPGPGGSECGGTGDEDSRDQESCRPCEDPIVGAHSRAGSNQRRSGRASGPARPGGAGRTNAGLYHLRFKHGVGSGKCVPGGPCLCSQRR